MSLGLTSNSISWSSLIEESGVRIVHRPRRANDYHLCSTLAYELWLSPLCFLLNSCMFPTNFYGRRKCFYDVALSFLMFNVHTVRTILSLLLLHALNTIAWLYSGAKRICTRINVLQSVDRWEISSHEFRSDKKKLAFRCSKRDGLFFRSAVIRTHVCCVMKNRKKVHNGNWNGKICQLQCTVLYSTHW